MSKKFLTKLLNKDFRKKIINSVSKKKLEEYKILQYARYTCDKVIISRNKEHENDREWQYGFSPLEVLAYIGRDGKLVTKLFEFNSVNHFLKDKDGDSAVDVITAILVDWVKNDGNIRDFDIDEIDFGLKKIEDEYTAEVKAKEEVAKKAEDAGRKIKERVEPIMNGLVGKPYDESLPVVEKEVRTAMDSLVADKTVAVYQLGYSRNTPMARSAGDFLLDIGYRVEPDSETIILRCDVHGQEPPAGSSISCDPGQEI